MAEVEMTATMVDRLIERATKFLGAASQVPAIRAVLDTGGYSEEEHRRGWELLLEVLGYRQNGGNAATVLQLRQRDAAAALDAWDGAAFERARAALNHHFPSHATFLFDGLSAKTGAEAVGAVSTFLDRVVALREGTLPAPITTRDEDRAAAELLARRRIVDASEEARLRALIAEATSLADLPTQVEPDPRLRQEKLSLLDAWLRDWRESARALITRRDYQIRLGLAERRSPKAGDEPSQVASESSDG